MPSALHGKSDCHPHASATFWLLQVLHAMAAIAWRRLHELPADALCNLLYGFGLLHFHPGS
jgi:hypothetical protein